jgi:rod shape-determining protein MreC
MKFIYTKTFFVFASILVVIVLALFLQVKGWLQPIEYLFLQLPKPAIALVNIVTKPVMTVVHTLGSMRKIVEENRNLTFTVSDLRSKQVILEQLQLENELLKKELDYKNKSAHQLQSCSILSMDPQNTSDAMVLGCGNDTGIKPGQAVISQGYLLAKIVYVGNQTSTAVLITNSQSTVDAKISKNNVEGVVKGSFGSGLVFDLVSQSAEANEGDLVVTAGIDPNIPKNILIGQIGQVISGSNDLFKRLTLVSPVRPNLIDYVFVVKP